MYYMRTGKLGLGVNVGSRNSDNKYQRNSYPKPTQSGFGAGGDEDQLGIDAKLRREQSRVSEQREHNKGQTRGEAERG